MKRIHKYTLNLGNNVIKAAGRIVRPLHVAMVGDKLCMWVEEAVDLDPHLHHYAVIATGATVPTPSEYIGTVVTDMQFVWHVYQV